MTNVIYLLDDNRNRRLQDYKAPLEIQTQGTKFSTSAVSSEIGRNKKVVRSIGVESRGGPRVGDQTRAPGKRI